MSAPRLTRWLTAPDAVAFPAIGSRRDKTWMYASWAVIGSPFLYYLTQPEHRTAALVLIPVVVTVMFVILGGSLWIEPAAGNVVVIRWGWQRRCYPLRADTRVEIVPSPLLAQQLLRVRVPERRTTFHVVLLALAMEDGRSMSPEHLRLIAGTLDAHCPTAAPDVVALLRAQAEHIAGGGSPGDSPLARS